jgi:prepilin-type N-terminal cleavage/methylation domain-containing protein
MHASPKHSERGVTLIELMIAISLVALLSAGMLIAMRTSLLTYEKTSHRLESNRRAMSVQQILASQIGGIMPVQGQCSSTQGPPITIPFFGGTQESLRVVSSFSMQEGARGYPRILEYQVVPAGSGGVRLIVNEHPYFGSSSTAPFCLDGRFLPAEAGPSSFVLADGLLYCRFSYHEVYNEAAFTETPWLPVWNQPALPSGVRIDMRPLSPDPVALPFAGVTIPIRVNRDVMKNDYADQ